MVMLTEFSFSQQVFPFSQLYLDDERVSVAEESKLNQPDRKEVIVMMNFIIFMTPRQKFIEYFTSKGYEIKLSVRRKNDEMISSTKFVLDYVSHDSPCTYCDPEIDSFDEIKPGIRAKRGFSRSGMKRRGEIVREGPE